MKDDLFYVQPIVEYATLSDYNHVSKMDFPKRKQPSSMFPTLPDVSPVVPLDALTHHTDMNYPTVNHAYGPFHRPKYYVGKCPSNQFVRNFDTPPPTTTPSPTMESYSETPTPTSKPIPPRPDKPTKPPCVKQNNCGEQKALTKLRDNNAPTCNGKKVLKSSLTYPDPPDGDGGNYKKQCTNLQYVTWSCNGQTQSQLTGLCNNLKNQ